MKANARKALFLRLLLTGSMTMAMAEVVKGIIADRQTREPLTGATVTAEGTTTGAVADLDGNYLLTLPKGTDTLPVKYIGYKDIRNYNEHSLIHSPLSSGMTCKKK